MLWGCTYSGRRRRYVPVPMGQSSILISVDFLPGIYNPWITYLFAFHQDRSGSVHEIDPDYSRV